MTLEKNQISVLQLVLLLFLSRAFVILTYVPGIGSSVSGAAVLVGNIIGYAVVMLCFLPVIVTAKKYPERSLMMNLETAWGGVGTFVGILYYLFVVLLASNTLAHFQFFMVNAVFTEANVWAILLPITAVAAYAAYTGIEGIARAGFPIAVGFTIALLFILCSSVPNLQTENIKFPVEGGMGEIALSAYGVVANTMEIPLAYLLLPYCKEKIKRGMVGLVIGLLLLTEAVTFFIVAVLGDFAASQTFPFYALASMSELSVFQRLDALHMGIWVFVAFLKLSLLIFSATEILRFIAPKGKNTGCFRQGCLAVTAVSVLGAAVPACYDIGWMRTLYRMLYSGIPIAVAGILIPIAVLWSMERRKKGASGKKKG